MGVNPFLSNYSGPHRFIDEDGEWDVELDHCTDQYVYRNARTNDVKFVDKQIQLDRLMGYARAQSYANAAPAVKVTLKDKREQRWRNKLVRMQDKKRARRLARLDTAMWVAGWVWGGCLAFVVTVYLIKWVMLLVLG